MYHLLLTSISFLLSHPNPSNHAVEFIKEYEKNKVEFAVYTTDDKVAQKFSNIEGTVNVISLRRL